mmetsp:Transcript_21869/g.39484  ORF Transcript_21869/g.39484 Transcript_21869/m.39484 type:complete len:115 (-) Transcript_21869:418-762(-)
MPGKSESYTFPGPTLKILQSIKSIFEFNSLMMISLRFVRVPGGGILAFQERCCCEYRFPLTHLNASEIVDRTRDCVRQTVQMPHGVCDWHERSSIVHPSTVAGLPWLLFASEHY